MLRGKSANAPEKIRIQWVTMNLPCESVRHSEQKKPYQPQSSAPPEYPSEQPGLPPEHHLRLGELGRVRILLMIDSAPESRFFFTVS